MVGPVLVDDGGGRERGKGVRCVYLGVFVDALHKSTANLAVGFKETHVERRNGKVAMRRGEKLERGEAGGTASDDGDLHAVVGVL